MKVKDVLALVRCNETVLIWFEQRRMIYPIHRDELMGDMLEKEIVNISSKSYVGDLYDGCINIEVK